MVHCLCYVSYYKQQSVVPLKSFIVHCVTARVSIYLDKKCIKHGFKTQNSPCAHLSTISRTCGDLLPALRTHGRSQSVNAGRDRECSVSTSVIDGIWACYASPSVCTMKCSIEKIINSQNEIEFQLSFVTKTHTFLSKINKSKINKSNGLV